MSDLVRWLDARDPPAPPSVRGAVEALAAGTDPSAPLPDRLAVAGLDALAAVVREPSERGTAHTLLAADALLTYACEAAAEAGMSELERLIRQLSFERFSQLMPGSI